MNDSGFLSEILAHLVCKVKGADPPAIVVEIGLPLEAFYIVNTHRFPPSLVPQIKVM